MTAGRVPAGASTPYQVVVEYPLTPASATVTNSGSAFERLTLVTASARSFPLLTWPREEITLANVRCTCPAMTSPAMSSPARAQP